MRLKFIYDDRQVNINGDTRRLDEVPEAVPANVHAVQVYHTYTEVELRNATNEVTAEPPDYVQALVAAWEAAPPRDAASETSGESTPATGT